jgi:hypothetical protein
MVHRKVPRPEVSTSCGKRRLVQRGKTPLDGSKDCDCANIRDRRASLVDYE